MPHIESETIVLKSHSLAEADRIIVAITHDHGVIRGVAKGIKRLNSKFGSSLEPFNLVKLSYFQKEERELVSIQNADILHSSFAVASGPRALSIFSYFSDLVLAFSLPGDPNKVLFRMLRACLQTDISAEERHDLLQFYFESWLLRLSGVLPDWRHCHTCGREFTEIDTPSFDSGQHLICAGCHGGRLSPPLGPRWLEALLLARKSSPDIFCNETRLVSAIAPMIEANHKIIERTLGHSVRAQLGSS